MKGGQEKVADIYTNKCINIKKTYKYEHVL